jgi:23S rRNA G2445 N2-methylase RlmL
LNDDYEKLPEGLRKAIEEERQIIVLMNPPYGRASNGRLGDNSSRTGIAKTTLREEMLNENYGKSVQQLYTQFMYRCKKYGFNICIFSKPNFITAPSFNKFRTNFLNDYNFKSGFVMDASEFADVKSWPLTFTILSFKK